MQLNEDSPDRSQQSDTVGFRYEALVDSLNDAFGIVNNQGILTYANQKFCELLDYPLEDMIGKPLVSFVDDENLFILQNNIRRRTEGMSSVYELEWTTRKGLKVQTIVSGTPLPQKDGVHQGSFAVVTDISWRIAAEKKYQLLAEQSIQGLTIIQNDRYVYVNPAFAFIIGYTVDEILALSPEEGWNLIHDDDKNYLLRLASDRRNGIPIPTPYEYRFVRRDGSIRWVQAFSSAIEFEGAKALQVLVIDVTEGKETEEKLRTSQEMLGTVMNTIPEYVFWKDLDSVYLGCNDNFALVSGVETTDNIIGKTDFDLAWKEVESELFRALDKEVIKTDRPQINIISPQLQADGREAWIEINVVPLHDDEEKVIGVLGTYQDITEKRMVEDNLRKSEEKYRSLAEQSLQGITILTSEKFLYYNPAFRDLVGYSDEELSPMSASDVWNLVHPDDGDELRKRMEDNIAGRPIPQRYEYRFIRKDGKIRWVESFTSRVEYSGTQAIQTMIVDITERRDSERGLRVATDRALLYLDLMGHDLAQQLQVILNSAALMQNAVEEANKESFMRIIADSIRRCARIIQEAKATEQLLTTPIRERKLDEALEGIIKAYSSQSENVDFKSSISVQNALIEADDFLELLISNIMMNAIEHNPKEDKAVWVQLTEAEMGYIVSISDNGTGITDAVKTSLFDSSRRYGGLGLHTAHYIVEKYNGRIEVHDRVSGDSSQGAEFRIWIPKQIHVIS